MTETGDHVDPGPVVMLPKGDPVYAVYTWRQDSITLARLRPMIEAIVEMADTKCEAFTVGWCGDYGRTPDAEFGADRMCWPCRLKQLRARIYGYRTQLSGGDQ